VKHGESIAIQSMLSLSHGNQPIGDAQCQHERCCPPDVFGVQVRVIEDDHLPRYRHQGRCDNELHVDHVFPKIQRDVDKDLDGNQDGEERAEDGKDVAYVEQQEWRSNKAVVQHPNDIEHAPNNDEHHKHRQRSHGVAYHGVRGANHGVIVAAPGADMPRLVSCFLAVH
jgi:hypothetical protein